MPPRVNSQGQYTDEGTTDHDGNVLPYTDAEIAATRAHEEAHGIPSTLPAAEELADDDHEDDDHEDDA